MRHVRREHRPDPGIQGASRCLTFDPVSGDQLEDDAGWCLVAAASGRLAAGVERQSSPTSREAFAGARSVRQFQRFLINSAGTPLHARVETDHRDLCLSVFRHRPLHVVSLLDYNTFI